MLVIFRAEQTLKKSAAGEPFRFLSAAKNVIGSYLASPHAQMSPQNEHLVHDTYVAAVASYDMP